MMRTQVINGTATDTPWLEHIPASGGAPVKTTVDPLPFSIGRSDAADLKIDSKRVSREHVVIERDGLAYRVRDNNSTNGTFLNGQRIDEAALEDGDMLVIADVEFSFFCGDSTTPQQTATMVMTSGDSSGSVHDRTRDIIHGVRRFQEMLIHRAVENLFQPILHLNDNSLLGYEAIPHEHWTVPPGTAGSSLMATECRLTGRLHQLHRMVAVEEAAGIPTDARLFLKLDPAEIGTEGLTDMLGRLQAVYQGRGGLVVEMPDSAVANTHHCRQFVERLRALGVSVAFDGFASGKAQVMEFEEFSPDYLKLAPAFARGAGRSSDRLRQIRAVVRAGQAIGCEVIVTDVQTEDEAESWRQAGCQYLQGDVAGAPRPVSSFALSARHEIEDSVLC